MKVSEYNRLSSFDRKLVTLMLRNGYVVRGNEVWSTAIGAYPATFVRHCRSIQDAAEQLCAIIRDDDYTTALSRLTSGIEPQFPESAMRIGVKR